MLSEAGEYFEKEYGESGLYAQRRWPNEEFCRFMGRRYFSKSRLERGRTKILEVGCGAGANLRLLSDEGYDTYGIELSEKAVELIPFLLQGANCDVRCGSMTELPWEDGYFDAIADVFSSFCLCETDFSVFADEIYRTLKSGGRYFSYTPSKQSDAFRNYKPAKKLDGSTLDGIRRQNSPFYGNFYPFRFMSAEDVGKFFDDKRFKTEYLETVTRTYDFLTEKFEFIVFEVVKK